MFAISIKQPWASLIIDEIKPVENRKWKTDYRGPLLIHASKTFDQKRADYMIRYAPQLKNIIEESKDFCGGIIGKVEMVDCVKNYDSWWFSGPNGFVFKDPEKINFFPCNGKLGLFKVEWPPDNRMLRDLQFYIDEFKSNECQCGNPKKAKKAFCYECYHALPKRFKDGLWQEFRQGYEQAYDEALIFLNG